MEDSELTIKEGYKQTDVGIIPEDWKVSTVGREFEIKLGKMLDAEKNVGTLKPYLGNKSVQWNRIDLDESQMMAMTQADLKRFRLRQGDLLVCEGGEVGRAAIWDSPIDECYYQKALHRLRPLRKFNTKLFLEFLHYWTDHGMLGNYVSQTSIAHLTREKFAEVPLPVPPLPEQQAIAEVLSDADALVTSLDRLITKKRNIKQGAMQLLLTGKKRLPGFSGDWETKTLGEIGECIIGLTYSPEDVRESGLLVLRSSNVQNNCLAYENNVFVNIEVPERIRTKEGDILICVRNGSRDLIGKSAIIDKKAEGLTFGAFMSVFRTKYFDYVFHLFQSNILKRQIRDNLGATINQITNKDLGAFEIPFPLVPEQKAIAQILSEMDAEIEALEIRRAKYKAVKQGMMQELLTGKTRLK